MKKFSEICHGRDNDVITKTLGKFGPPRNETKLYIIRKVMMRAFQKCNFYFSWVTESKVMANKVKFWPILVDFTMTSH